LNVSTLSGGSASLVSLGISTTLNLPQTTLGSTLSLPPTTATTGFISIGGSPVVQAYNNNFFLGGAGNFTATGSENLGIGFGGLANNTNGGANTVSGFYALGSNTNGCCNTAEGFQALVLNMNGSANIALGAFAGQNLRTGDNNIDIGNYGIDGDNSVIRIGSPGAQTNTYIAGISGSTVAAGVGVYVDFNGQLGTLTSSARFKQDIQKMGEASESILALQPVTFRYKRDIDPHATPQFGLVAEEVEKVDPALVARDAEGRPYSVRYEAVNAMLLNEFIKQHQKVREQATEIEDLKVRLERLEQLSRERSMNQPKALIGRTESREF
jgi:hypothetical protein